MVVYPKMPIDDGVFYNLVIQKINGNISKIIYKYTPEVTWFNDYKNNISSPYKGKIDLIYQEGNFTKNISSKAINCRAEYIEIPCDFGYYHDDAHCEASGSYFIKITICEDTGGGGPTISYGSGSGSSGSTGGSGGSIVTPEGFENSFPYGNEYNDAYQSFKFNMHFAPNEKQWLSTHSSASVNLFWYVYNMGNTDEAFAVAKKYVQFSIAGQNTAFSSMPYSWVINFIAENPDTTWLQFESWFITKSEGSDGEPIDNIDDILNTIDYQTRQMPTYTQFLSAFPKLDYYGYPGYYKQMPAAQVYSLVGDPLKSLYISKGGDNGIYRNACTVRWSLAMNRLGILIPQNSLRGADINGQPRYYYMRAVTAGDAMQKIFGNPTYKLEGADANNPTKVANFLKGKTGIYVIVNNDSNQASYTGHVDLIQNGHIPGGSNAYNVPGGIKSIRIWKFTP